MTTSFSDIVPVLSTPEFVVRPLVPVSFELQQNQQRPEKTPEIKETLKNNESIDDWLKNLTEKSVQSAGLCRNGRRHHKRHRSAKKFCFNLKKILSFGNSTLCICLASNF